MPGLPVMEHSMRTPSRKAIRRRHRGVMLIEALLAILIFSLGILAVVGMQSVAIKEVAQSKFRGDAAFLTQELMGQMWIDNGNIASYAYAGAGTPPDKIARWVQRVGGALPGSLLPVVTITNPTAQGADVSIQIFWQMPEEAAQTPPVVHQYTVVGSIYTS
jgi:type IV pilus assembly protein PilV